MDEDQTACFEAGMDDFVAKPVRLEGLADALTPSLNRVVA
jgi:CheY-like chemotaxis protein